MRDKNQGGQTEQTEVKFTPEQKDMEFVRICEEVAISDTPTIDEIVKRTEESPMFNGGLARTTVQQRRSRMNAEGWNLTKLPKKIGSKKTELTEADKKANAKRAEQIRKELAEQAKADQTEGEQAEQPSS